MNQVGCDEGMKCDLCRKSLKSVAKNMKCDLCRKSLKRVAFLHRKRFKKWGKHPYDALFPYQQGRLGGVFKTFISTPENIEKNKKVWLYVCNYVTIFYLFYLFYNLHRKSGRTMAIDILCN